MLEAELMQLRDAVARQQVDLQAKDSLIEGLQAQLAVQDATSTGPTLFNPSTPAASFVEHDGKKSVNRGRQLPSEYVNSIQQMQAELRNQNVTLVVKTNIPPHDAFLGPYFHSANRLASPQ